MATKHWVRDVPLTDPANYIANGNHMMGNALMYNFLRVAGWKWIWECDGERGSGAADPNHVQDGHVQVDSMAYWSSYNGGAVSKDETKVHSGVRSLKVVAANAGEGVLSAALLTMANPSSWTTDTGDSLSGPTGREMTFYDDTSRFATWNVGWYIYFSGNSDPNNDGEFVVTKYINGNTIRLENPSGSPVSYYSGTPPPAVDVASVQLRPSYELAVWAATDEAFDVEVDQGDGSFVNIGTIPDNGNVFTLYTFSFRRVGTGSSYIRFVSQAAGTLYVGGVLVYNSIWDKTNLIKRGTDGSITNPDKFSSAGFTFDDSDVGRVLFLWDATYNKNSGAYVITSVAAGVATLDLRSGSASLTSSNNIRWRLATVDYLTYPNYSLSEGQMWCGFGLESPHSSKWRFFLRQSQRNGPNTKGSVMWASPEDTDFNFGSGAFYKSGPSTQRNRQLDYWTEVTTASQHLWRGGYSYKTSPHDSRFFFMTDEDGSFFNFFLWDEDGDHGCFLTGYLTNDPPDIEGFHFAARWSGAGAVNECHFDNSTRFGVSGSTFAPDGTATTFCLAQLGISQIATDSTEVETQSNAGPNPWSGREWLRPLILMRDVDNNRNQAAIHVADCGVYQGRSNMGSLTTFDSDAFLHLNNSLVWEWSGESVL